MTKVIIYYTDNVSVESYIAEAVKRQLLKADLPIISVSQKPMDFGRNICIGEIGRSKASMAKQVLLGLDSTNADIIFTVEHDVLYHPSHFEFIPEDSGILYFNQNLWRVRTKDGANFRDFHNGAMSQLAGMKWNVWERYIEILDFYVNEKPLTGLPGYDWYKSKPPGWSKAHKFKGWMSPVGNLDLRHGGNLTGTRRFSMQKSGRIPGWDEMRNRFRDFLEGLI